MFHSVAKYTKRIIQVATKAEIFAIRTRSIYKGTYPTQWNKVDLNSLTMSYKPLEQSDDKLSKLQDIFVEYNGMRFYTTDWYQLLQAANITDVDKFINLYETAPESPEFASQMKNLLIVSRRPNILNLTTYYARQKFDIDKFVKEIQEINRDKSITFTFIGPSTGETMLTLYCALAKYIGDNPDIMHEWRFRINGIEINDLCIEKIKYKFENGTEINEIDEYLLNEEMREKIILEVPIWGNICRIDKHDQFECQELLKMTDKVFMFNVVGEFTDEAKRNVQRWFNDNLKPHQIDIMDFEPVGKYTPFHQQPSH